MMNDTTATRPAFIAFASGDADIATLKAFAASQQWPEGGVHKGDITTATEFLKANASPLLLLVEIPGAQEAPALLDALADVCAPDTKVITIGGVNEYSFYCWLMEIGIFSYLLKPLTQPMLEGAYQKSIAAPSQVRAKSPAKIIAVMGARGGVGATTVALNLAGILADLSGKHVGLVDIDPQEGSIALTLDIEPSRGLRDVLEKPDRIDSLFIERVMSKPIANLSVLSAEESLQERVNIHPQAGELLLTELRDKCDLLVLDIPRHLNSFSQQCLQQADHVILVTELTLLSLRDALRMGDLARDTFKMKAPLIVANRVGLAAKKEIKVADFEKGINAELTISIPFAPEVYMQVSTDIPAVKQKEHKAVKALYDLALMLFPEYTPKTDGKAKKSFFAKKVS